MPDAFDMLGDPVTTDKGTIYDYDASLGEAFGAGFDRQMDTNPLALAARQARFFSEDMGSLAGIGERVDQKTAEEEVRRRGLDLKIPKGGITRYELDTLQYLKQREIAQNTVGARARGITGAAAGFAGGVAGSFTDPINIASNFIPFVSEARYASWLARAGTNTLARAGVRAGAGAIEGAAGAAVLEPLVYAGATSQQLDYTSTDSFLNVVFGGVMGGGLHPIGGAVYDARVSRALRGLDPGIFAMRDAVANAPDHVKRDIFQAAVAQVERGEPVNVEPVAANIDQIKHPAPLPQYETGYHGTATMFDDFEARHNDLPILAPGNASTNGAPITVDQPAVYFTSSKEEALDFAKTAEGENPRIIERKIPINDLLTVDLKGDHFLMHQGPAFLEAQKQGKKGVRFLNAVDTATNSKRPATVYAVFDPALVNAKGAIATVKQSTPRDLGGLIEQAKADRSEAAFNRQFGDEADEAASRAADEAVTKASEDLQTVAEDVKFLDDQIKGLKSRELWTKADDDAIAQGDEAAKAYEKEASIYRAAAVCMMEG